MTSSIHPCRSFTDPRQHEHDQVTREEDTFRVGEVKLKIEQNPEIVYAKIWSLVGKT